MVQPLGFEGIAINAWLVWILPFAGAAIIAAVARISHRIRDYVAVGFALASAIFATTLIPLGLSGSEAHSQISWISTLGVKAGVLADPLAIVMTNLVGWVSFLIFVYSTGYMHGDKDLTRFWFFMLFFIGSMQLIVLSDNLLMVFFGWKTRTYGVGHRNVDFSNSRWNEGFSNDKGRRYNDAGWNVSNFCICWNLWLQRINSKSTVGSTDGPSTSACSSSN